MFRTPGEVVRVPIQNSRHSKTGTDEKRTMLKCELCGQKWDSISEMYYHKRKHYRQVKRLIRKGEHFCWTCVKPFNNEKKLIEHLKVYHYYISKDSTFIDREIYVCNYCHKVFFNDKMLVLHLKRQHPSSNNDLMSYECPICLKGIGSKNNPKMIWSHLYYLHKMVNTVVVCPICFLKCNTIDDITNHVRTHKTDIFCGICNRDFTSMDLYNDHLVDHNTDNDIEIQIESELIKRVFIPEKRTEFSYPKLQVCHGLCVQKELQICVFCREICTTRDERIEHVYKHVLIKAKPQPPIPIPIERKEIKNKYKCVCGVDFPQNILLKQHLLKNKDSETIHQAIEVRKDECDSSKDSQMVF